MEVVMVISPVLRPFVDNRESVVVDGETAEDCLNDLATKFPETRKWVFDINDFPAVWVLLNDDIVLPGELAKKIRPGDRISLIPMLAGG